MNIRLKQFLAAENISQSQFADTIKVVRASVSHVLAGRNKPGYDFIKAIMTAYPHLSMEWLIMGNGKMYKQTSEPDLSQLPQSEIFQTNEENDVPLLFDDYSDETDEQLSEPLQNDTEHQATPAATMWQQRTNTSTDTTQSIAKQRKAIKIAVFYDDGTYQEFQNL